MNDFSKNNFFLSTIYDLYECIYLEKEQKREGKNIFLFLNKKKEKTKVDIIYEQGLDKVNYLKYNIPNFDKLFDFCTFIRSMEKVFFFKNDNQGLVSSDSDINNMIKRNLYINTEKYRITMNLERIDNFTGESIDIQIFRKYGKKLTNNFKIKNRHVIYNDCDDLMLMNVLNMLLQNIMADVFKKYINIIYNKELLDMKTYDFKEIK